MTAATPALDAFPLIPRDALFGNPTRSQGKISPDGKWLSWLAPHNEVMNIWLAPRDAPGEAKVISKADDRPIPQHLWRPIRTASSTSRTRLATRTTCSTGSMS